MLPYMLQLITRNTNRMATTIIIGVLTGLLLYCTFSIRNGGQPVREKQPEKSETYLPSTTTYDKMLTLSNSHDIYAQTSERHTAATHFARGGRKAGAAVGR